jgi:putative transcriptional regulator
MPSLMRRKRGEVKSVTPIAKRAAMEKKVKRRLGDDIRASLHEALDHAAGRRTKAIVHMVTPRETDARRARLKLGLSQREFASFIGTAVGTVRKWELGTRKPSGAARALIAVIKAEPKAVRRAITRSRAAS